MLIPRKIVVYTPKTQVPASGRTPGISPPSLIFGSNLKRWYKENYTNATGIYVDETGNGNATQGVALSRPTETTINGHPCMECDNTQTQFLSTGTTADIISDNATLFAVISGSLVGSTRVIIGKYYNQVGWAIGCSTNAAGKLSGFSNNVANDAAADSAAASPSATHTVVWTYDKLATPTSKLWIDGVEQADTATDATDLTDAADIIGVGAGSDPTGTLPTSGWIGKLGNIGVVNVTASAGQLTALHSYLKTWGGVA